MDIHVDFAGERKKEHSSIFPLVLMLLFSQPCTCSAVPLGQALRGTDSPGTEFAPSFPLFLPLGCSLWFSLDTQRHTCTKPHNLSADRTALIEAHFGPCWQCYEQEQPAKAWDFRAPDRNGRVCLGNTPQGELLGNIFPFLFFSLSFPPAEVTFTIRGYICHQAYYRPC